MSQNHAKVATCRHVHQRGIYLLRPMTEAARAWIEENIPDDAPMFGGALAVEHRYVADVVQGMQSDGLLVN